jgi:hypothetical protein
LAQLLADPYGVVRYVAEHSLAKLPAFEGFRYDFLASHEERLREVGLVQSKWLAGRAEPPSKTGVEVLIDAAGNLMEAQIRSLLEERDDRPVSIKE